MIVDERMSAFINSFAAPLEDYLDKLEQFSIETNVPIIRKEMQTLMRFLLRMTQPLRVLEVGTAIGFSSLFMKENLPENARITTIEKYEKRIPVAKGNFEKYDLRKQITLLEGDATEILQSLEGEFDFIFMDAAKGQYINFFPDIMRLLADGGILLSDNVMQDGDILESRYAVTRRNRTIYSRMRDYLYELTHNKCLETVILPVGDGVTISVKRSAISEKA